MEMKIRNSCSPSGEEQDGSFLGEFERKMEMIASMVDQQEVEEQYIKVNHTLWSVYTKC